MPSLKNTIIFATMRHQKSQLCIYSLNIGVVLRECLFFKGLSLEAIVAGILSVALTRKLTLGNELAECALYRADTE